MEAIRTDVPASRAVGATVDPPATAKAGVGSTPDLAARKANTTTVRAGTRVRKSMTVPTEDRGRMVAIMRSPNRLSIRIGSR